jgi:peptidoglycan/LPS O-acetylase OafA/YrhL
MAPQTQKAGGYAQPKRIESLDSVRGLAALAVLLGHTIAVLAWPNYLVGWAGFPVVNILFDGRSAVTMFFVLSGFVLSRPYLVQTPTGQAPRRMFIPTFYLRRFTRIWIPWFFVFCLSAIMRRYLFRSYHTDPPMSELFKHFWSSALSISSFFRQCAFMLHNASQQLLPQDWTLGVELKGSALIPVFIFLVRRHILFLFAAAVPLLAFIPTGSYYVSFILGVFAASHYNLIESIMHRLAFPLKCGILAFGVLLYQTRLWTSHLWGDSVIADHFAWCICSIGCLIIITASLGSDRIQAALSHGMLVFLGRISYSVYLLQVVVLLCVLPPLMHWFNMIGVRSMAVLMPLAVFISVFVTVVSAAFAYRIVEVPSMALGHWSSSFIQRRFLRRSTKSEIQQKAT